ncbi:hypothetical protein ES703_80247 [subsurface metagenome]
MARPEEWNLKGTRCVPRDKANIDNREIISKNLALREALEIYFKEN